MQAVAIARLDDAAIAQAAKDPKALAYGLGVSAMTVLIPGTIRVAGAVADDLPVNWLGLVIGTSVLIVMVAILTTFQMGACHLLARWWFQAQGSFIALLHPMFLGNIVFWVASILLPSDLW